MKNYKFINYATQGYVALVGLLILLFHGDRIAHWPLIVFAHAFCLALVQALILAQAFRPNNPLVGFFRHFYPILLYTGFYRETGLLNQMFVTGFLDPAFIRLEGLLFGSQPSLLFMDVLPYAVVSEVFYAAYFSYYLMISGVGVALSFRTASGSCITCRRSPSCSTSVT